MPWPGPSSDAILMDDCAVIGIIRAASFLDRRTRFWHKSEFDPPPSHIVSAVYLYKGHQGYAGAGSPVAS